MFDPKRYVLAGGTVVAALAIGTVMQQSGSAPGAKVPVQTVALDTRVDAEPTALADPAMASLGGMVISGISDAAAQVDPGTRQPSQAMAQDTPDRLAALDTDVPVQTDTVAADTCDISMTAQNAPAAMVDLAITAPCLPNEVVTIHHNGIMFSAMTNAAGVAEMQAPALSPEALFIAAFANGSGAVVSASVPEMDGIDRVVLQWRGDAGFQVHALENGAGYGQAGHVWQDAPASVDDMLRGQGGFIIKLGDWSLTDGLRGEVYSFPSASTAAAEVVLTAEAQVTPTNCNKQIEAQALQWHDGGLTVQELTLAVPSCEVVGDILMLKNLLQDLKIASN